MVQNHWMMACQQRQQQASTAVDLWGQKGGSSEFPVNLCNNTVMDGNTRGTWRWILPWNTHRYESRYLCALEAAVSWPFNKSPSSLEAGTSIDHLIYARNTRHHFLWSSWFMWAVGFMLPAFRGGLWCSGRWVPAQEWATLRRGKALEPCLCLQIPSFIPAPPTNNTGELRHLLGS